LIVGEGPDRARLERHVHETALKNVLFLGHLQRDQLPAIYHAADLFVFPTLEDCWALVVNEAMVAGLPVINSKYAGSTDMIVDGLNGWVVDPLDAADMLRGLRLAWEARHKLASMAPHIRSAVTPMTIPAVAERIRNAVRTVASTRQGTRRVMNGLAANLGAEPHHRNDEGW
jgi:glycosyltransferase involved in cell wall biosynthesis